MVRLVVGLGNPAPRYTGTRHNVGRDFVDHLAHQARASFQRTRSAEIIRLPGFFSGQPDAVLALAKLSCYMNESGPSFQRLLEAEGFPLEQTLVVVDDFMIPFGSLRLRSGGSSGGHNGLKSINETIGTEDYARLRVGVGPVPPGMDPADFVLESFTRQEDERIPDLYGFMREAMAALELHGLQKAMSMANKTHFEMNEASHG